jgi:hypothetical protein
VPHPQGRLYVEKHEVRMGHPASVIMVPTETKGGPVPETRTEGKYDMSFFIEEYLRRGYRDIVVLVSDVDEKQDWHGTEHRTETVVARKDEEFTRADAYQKAEFGPGGSRDISITETVITEQAYSGLVQGQRVLDTPEIRKDFDRSQAVTEKAKAIKDSIEAVAPTCPVHGKRMKLVQGPMAVFFGCVKGSKCSEKRWLTEQQKKRTEIFRKVPGGFGRL